MSKTLEQEIRNLATRIQMDEREGSPSLDDLARLPAMLERWAIPPPGLWIPQVDDPGTVQACDVVCALH